MAFSLSVFQIHDMLYLETKPHSPIGFLSVLLPNSSDKSEENSVAHRRSLLYQSTTTLKVTQAMAVAIEQTPLANGLRRAQNTVKFPAEALAFAATIVSQLHVQNAYTNVSIDRNATQAHA